MRRIPCLFTSLVLVVACLATEAGANEKRIAITIDDVPVLSATDVSTQEVARINARLLFVLKERHVKAVGFVTEVRLFDPERIQARVDILDSWLAAGMELGNHNFSHIGLWQSSLAENEAAVIKGEEVTRRLSAAHGSPLRYYRHPFTQTGKDDAEKQAFERFLHAHGYTVAPFTIEHDDYLYSCVYDKLIAASDDTEKDAVVREYTQHLRDSVATFERMSEELLGRKIPQVLLIHATRLNAVTLPAMLDTLAHMGYSFVPLDEVLQDDAYSLPTKASGPHGPSWIARWARAGGKKLSAYGQRDPSGRTAELASSLACAG